MGDGGYCDICRTHATPEQVAAARHYFDKLARFSTWKLMLAAEQKGSK